MTTKRPDRSLDDLMLEASRLTKKERHAAYVRLLRLIHHAVQDLSARIKTNEPDMSGVWGAKMGIRGEDACKAEEIRHVIRDRGELTSEQRKILVRILLRVEEDFDKVRSSTDDTFRVQ